MGANKENPIYSLQINKNLLASVCHRGGRNSQGHGDLDHSRKLATTSNVGDTLWIHPTGTQNHIS